MALIKDKYFSFSLLQLNSSEVKRAFALLRINSSELRMLFIFFPRSLGSWESMNHPESCSLITFSNSGKGLQRTGTPACK